MGLGEMAIVFIYMSRLTRERTECTETELHEEQFYNLEVNDSSHFQHTAYFKRKAH